ncbi:hypothetical protein H1P_3480002 [Hyella patelloides LEGE 07179]|uniref:Uncharacterized protein n=1 Tax=Hyella patelloides LEGE 07179 TaxID=945734 RepID=A0A563VVS4_9CYAN|nr:hypothetical protein [Hyella patelloides]VEP15558.1 hypothetical protein H1P_3480002 [Hyella patelloides LEGE 07179]
MNYNEKVLIGKIQQYLLQESAERESHHYEIPNDFRLDYLGDQNGYHDFDGIIIYKYSEDTDNYYVYDDDDYDDDERVTTTETTTKVRALFSFDDNFNLIDFQCD